MRSSSVVKHLTRCSVLVLACTAVATSLWPAVRAQIAEDEPTGPGNDDGVVQFVDVTNESGIRFVHQSGAAGQKFLPETLGSGVLFLDVDADGWQDILFVNSTRWPGDGGNAAVAALYRNDGDGTFTDISAGSGLDVELYGIGGTAADYDNDGHVDVYLTALGGNRLFRGRGDGTFADVTATSGVGGGDDEFSTGALWFDYDNDGALDLFVVNYVDWSPAADLFCSLDGENKSYCTPEVYSGQGPRLYRNQGDGTFEDVTTAAGFDASSSSSKSLGVAILDYDGDGWMDVFVANDREQDRLYHNDGDGHFADDGIVAGVAFSEDGVARAGMGVDAADYDRSGRPSLIVGNFSNEMMALYHNEGNGLFIDESPRSALGRGSLLTLTFACFFFDYDLDGYLDLFAANGHVADDVGTVQSRVTYAQPPHLFRGFGDGRFDEVTAQSGTELAQAMVARGAAYGDIDRDGDLDLVVTVNNGAARLFRNDAGSTHAVLRVRTEGTVSNRDGVGARVDVTVAPGDTRWHRVKTGSSYASQSELPLTFGLGVDDSVVAIRVTWPSGVVDTVTRVAANHEVTFREGEGIVDMRPILYSDGDTRE